MRFVRFLERCLGWAAIPNVTQWIVILQVCVYICLHVPMRDLDPNAMTEKLLFIPERFWAGEWWRAIAFLLLPPLSNVFFAFFAWYLFWLMGSALENTWGTFRYNLYLWTGWLATIAAALVTHQAATTNVYLQMSVFLAFAYLFPNFEILIFFILPVKVKWLALLNWIGIAWSFLFGTWDIRLMAAASVLNFLLYFGLEVRMRMKYGARRMAQGAARMSRREPEYRHRCVICGVTDRTNPEMEFRYCSRCAGQPCYCSEHLQNHEHLTAEPTATQPP